MICARSFWFSIKSFFKTIFFCLWSALCSGSAVRVKWLELCCQEITFLFTSGACSVRLSCFSSSNISIWHMWALFYFLINSDLTKSRIFSLGCSFSLKAFLSWTRLFGIGRAKFSCIFPCSWFIPTISIRFICFRCAFMEDKISSRYVGNKLQFAILLF